MADRWGEGERISPFRRGGQDYGHSGTPSRSAVALGGRGRFTAAVAQAGKGRGDARPPPPALPQRQGGRPEGWARWQLFLHRARPEGAELSRAAPRRELLTLRRAGLRPGGDPPPPRTGKCGRGSSPAFGGAAGGPSTPPAAGPRLVSPLPAWPLLHRPLSLSDRPFIPGCRRAPFVHRWFLGASPLPRGQRAPLPPPCTLPTPGAGSPALPLPAPGVVSHPGTPPARSPLEVLVPPAAPVFPGGKSSPARIWG